jgi:AmmeMemoRadiSam system protein B
MLQLSTTASTIVTQLILRGLLLAYLLSFRIAAPVLATEDPGNRFLNGTEDASFINRAIERERPYAVSALPVTGITVPHHFLAADLIARGVIAASGGTYDRVLILSPDHFLSLKTPFGISTADLETSLGTLFADRPFAQRVLSATNLFSDIGAAQREHGIHAITPFLRAIFPDVRIAAVTTAYNVTPAQLRAAAELLARSIRPKTLIVQSTDYSHLLPDRTAALRDQETVSAIASTDPQEVLSLAAPDHMDSRPAQFIQMALQRRLYNAVPVIIANRNSHDYLPATGETTTTYIVSVYTPEPERAWRLRYPDQTLIYFGSLKQAGVGLPGRASAKDGLLERVKERTGSSPLVINLQVQDERSRADHKEAVASPLITVSLLENLGVVAVNPLNSEGSELDHREEFLRLLEVSGFQPLRDGVAAQIGQLNITSLNFNRPSFPERDATSASQLICQQDARLPRIVLTSGSFEHEVMNKLAYCGVSALIGSNSQSASRRIELHPNGALQFVSSTGKLSFTPTDEASSGSLVEARSFWHGTVALRLIPVPSLPKSIEPSN